MTVVEVTRDNYASEILGSPGVVLVDFWGPRCIPCMELMPTVEELARTYGPRLKVATVNVTQARRLCIEQRVMTVPAFLFYKDGKEMLRLGPEVNADDLKDKVHSFLEAP